MREVEEKIYLCIDLKSFFASVECVERGLDPMTTKLVVADPERSDKTICLAITPAMKALGIKNRCRVFEIPKNVEYIVAPPRMSYYLKYSAEVYGVYLKYLSKDDVYVYSIDEAFLDVTHYLSMYGLTARELAIKIMDDILMTTGVRATCGIGTNMYLTKIALDITAKHSPDFIGELDEKKFVETLWDHKPLTDFWRIGAGTAKKLAEYGIMTMGGIARADEDFMYRVFGIDAELMIDHAWGREPVTMEDIKKYKPKTNSIASGQVLMEDYSFADGRIIVKEMMDLMCLDLVENKLVTESITLHVGYSNALKMESARGTKKLDTKTNADILLVPAIAELYERIVDKRYPIRRINMTCNNVIPEEYEQYNFFVNSEDLAKNRKIQEAMISIKQKYGKNAVLKGMNLQNKAMTMERNKQIGGHKSGE